MKYKKYSYLIVLVAMLLIGINKTYADSQKNCYYMSENEDFKMSISITYNGNPYVASDKFKSEATLWKTGKGQNPLSTDKIENWFKSKKIADVSIEGIYNGKAEADSDPNPTCPKYIIYTSCPGWFFGWGTSNKTFVTNSGTTAQNAVKAANSNCSYANYASNYKDGHQITKEEFFNEFITEGLIEYDKTKGEYTCSDMNELFGSKDDPDSIRYMVNEVLTYVRIIVPILIILLGTIDFAKAVIAGKEDNMKKAQSDFIKRLIAGVIVFLVPTLVDIIMGLADIVWNGEYIHCPF